VYLRFMEMRKKNMYVKYVGPDGGGGAVFGVWRWWLDD